MPKRYRKMKGGFLDSIGSTLSGWGSSISEGASSAWSSTKKATTSAYDSATGTTPTTNYVPTTGGRRKRSRRHMRGGFTDNTPTTGLAAHAAPVTDINTAQPQTMVGEGYAQPEWLSSGGKSRKHKKSRKSRKSRRRH